MFGCCEDANYEIRQLKEKIESLEARIENAGQAMSETHSSWKSRCFAITAALDMDYGNPDDEMPGESNPKIESMKELRFWLEGALQCDKWEWSPDQATLAQDALDRANAIITKYEEK